ncbi:DUF6402 family protein [Proteus sp. NMG38-2]|uniref:DUF6402 family protein n=1 Tax=Proteus sp. NMG38-2 TaxID=2883107 RepID=UPI001D0B8DF5|nr:DUF6402 family protein [Proteus sp. NMG38-2]UDN36955.1 DUF6402 family protein [Proteus sp. NMG38-2]
MTYYKTVEGGTTTELETDIFYLNQIPDAMERMGWETAPKLMRHWFSITPAYPFKPKEKIKLIEESATLIPTNLINTNIVKMGWALNYIQVKESVGYLLNNWATPKGINLLKKRLGSNTRIGYTDSAIELDSYAQVNSRPIGGTLDTINDYYGALGKATIKIAVKGYITKVNSRDAFITEMLGIYIKDSYDFSAENEPLGVWSKNGIMNKTQTLLYMGFYNQNMWKELADGGFSGSVPIYNKNFREWQEKRNEGGDFIVFSDILWSYPMPNDRVIYL